MSKVYVLINLDSGKVVGVITNKKVADKINYSVDLAASRIMYAEEKELDDPELLNRLAREETPYKGAINIPCSACGEDPKMEYHDHMHVRLEDRRED